METISNQSIETKSSDLIMDEHSGKEAATSPSNDPSAETAEGDEAVADTIEIQENITIAHDDCDATEADRQQQQPVSVDASVLPTVIANIQSLEINDDGEKRPTLEDSGCVDVGEPEVISAADDSNSQLLPPEVCEGATAQAITSLPKDITNDGEKTSIYKIKTIKWNDGSLPIITQNENGPCPLIAIVNVLILNNKKNPFGSKQVISSEELMSYLGETILHTAPQNYLSESAQLNYEQNMADAISVFPKLQTGLDVNVKFTGVKDFEYTPECIIFDLLYIPLYHGWLVDPQANDVEKAVGKLSYNQLVEKIITNKSSTESDLVTEALVAENFLERSASQLTHYGLCELNNVMKSGELAVLFRNNHFSTIHKYKNELFQLVTDQGFLHESNVVWETLSNIDGDGQFVDGAFVTVPPKPLPSGKVAPLTDSVTQEEQIKQDFLVALSLQKEESREEEIAANWEEYKSKELGITSEITDEELAWRLHEDEQKHAQADTEARRGAAAQNANEPQPKQQSPSEANPGQPPKKKSDCVIL